MTEEQPSPIDKATLVDRIDASRRALAALLDSLAPERLAAPDDAGWSVKDHLAHLAAWEASLVPLVQGLPRHEGLGIDQAAYETSSEDGLNELIYQRHKDLPLAEVRTLVERSNRELDQLLEGLDDDALARPYSHYQPADPPYNARPIVEWVTGNTWEHFDEHAGWIRELAGDG